LTDRLPYNITDIRNYSSKEEIPSLDDI